MRPKTCNRNHEIRLKDQNKVISCVPYGRLKTFFPEWNVLTSSYLGHHESPRDISRRSPSVSNLTQSWNFRTWPLATPASHMRAKAFFLPSPRPKPSQIQGGLFFFFFSFFMLIRRDSNPTPLCLPINCQFNAYANCAPPPPPKKCAF